MMKRLLPILCFLLLFSVSVFSQSKEDEAKVLYQKAETIYDQIKNSQGAGYSDIYRNSMIVTNKKSFNEALDYINKAAKLIGDNPKILYLKVRLFADGISYGAFDVNEQNYQMLKLIISRFFDMADKNTYPPEKYTEMINAKIDVDGKLKPFAEAKLEKKLYEESLESRELAFLKDTFDVYMQKFVKSFDFYNAARFDEKAENHVTKDLGKKIFVNSFSIREQRKAMKEHPETGPYPHHLEYNPATKQLYVYYYAPDKGDNSYCCTDTIYTLGSIVYKEQNKPLAYYSSTDQKIINRSGYDIFPLDSVIFRNKVNYKSTPVRMQYQAGHTMIRYYVDVNILNRLMEIMAQTGFDKYYYYNTVFAFVTPNSKNYIRHFQDNSWGEFAWPNKEPVFTYQTINTSVWETILFDSSRNLYIRITHNECFYGRDKNNINTKLYTGSWMRESQVGK